MNFHRTAIRMSLFANPEKISSRPKTSHTIEKTANCKIAEIGTEHNARKQPIIREIYERMLFRTAKLFEDKLLKKLWKSLSVPIDSGLRGIFLEGCFIAYSVFAMRGSSRFF